VHKEEALSAGLDPASLEAVRVNYLDAALDAINAAMDYHIIDAHDREGASDALALARLLGLDPNVVERARALAALQPQR